MGCAALWEIPGQTPVPKVCGRRSNTITTTDTFAYASELVAAVYNWIHIYNTRRRHSTIEMLSPTTGKPLGVVGFGRTRYLQERVSVTY